MSYRVPMMFHPTHAVPDLEEAKVWFRRVFRREQIGWAERWDFSKLNADYPVDYSFFTHIAEVVFDTLCPYLMTHKNIAPGSVKPEMWGLTWWVDGIGDLAKTLAAQGYQPVDQSGNAMQADALPMSRITPDCYLFYTRTSDTGLRYGFAEWGKQHIEYYSRKGDPRLRPGWKLPPPDPADPLCVEKCSHHTILTQDTKLATRFYIDVLGGKIVKRAHNGFFDGESIFVAYADAILEFVEKPRRAAPNLSAEDFYHGLTFKVTDLGKVRRHLSAEGIGLIQDESTIIRTDPKDCLGVCWGFTSELDKAFLLPA